MHPNLGHVPFRRRVDKRILFVLEQLLALLCILGLAERLGLKDEQGSCMRKIFGLQFNAGAHRLKSSQQEPSP